MPKIEGSCEKKSNRAVKVSKYVQRERKERKQGFGELEKLKRTTPGKLVMRSDWRSALAIATNATRAARANASLDIAYQDRSDWFLGDTPSGKRENASK